MSGNNTSTSHLKPQLSALDVLVVLGYKQPQRGSQSDYASEVRQLAQQVQVGFQVSQDQIRQLRAIQPSGDAMTHQIDSSFREDWTIAMFLLGGAPQFGNNRKITTVSEQVIAQGRHICQQHGISLEAAATGLREASQELASSTR